MKMRIFNNSKDFIRKNKILLRLLCILFVILIIFVYGRIEIIENDVYKDCFKDGNEGNVSAPLQSGDKVIQEIPILNDSIRGLAVLFSTFGSEVTGGKVHIELLDENTESYFSVNIDATEIKDNQYLEIEFVPIIPESYIMKYTLCMTFEGIEGQNICFRLTDNGAYDDYCLSINGEGVPRDIIISQKLDNYRSRFYYSYIAMMSVMLITIISTHILIYKCGIKIHNIYLFVGVILGLIYMMVIPINVVPDEQFHMYSAYSVSNSMLGIEDNSSNGTIVMRADDANQALKYRVQDRLYYEEYYNLFTKLTVDDSTIVETSYIPVNAYFHLYFFAGIGITLGRMLGLGTLWVLLLGRIFNLLVFVLGTYYAIRKIPFGKSVVFIWALLPITLQQVASYSYDAFILTLSVIVIGLTLKLTYDNSESRKSEQVILFICIILLAPSKSLAITPLCVLPVIIGIKNVEKRKYVFSMMLTMILAISIFNIEPMNSLLTVGNKNISHMYKTDDMGYELGYLIRHPKEVFLIVCNTIYKNFDFHFETFLGRRLGYYEIILPIHVLLPYFIMLIIAGIKEKEETQWLSEKAKFLFVLIALFGYGFASGGMLLSWTKTSVKYIEGVQGRYFLPFAILPFLAIRNEKIVKDKEINNELVFASVWLEVLPLFCIYRYFV